MMDKNAAQDPNVISKAKVESNPSQKSLGTTNIENTKKNESKLSKYTNKEPDLRVQEIDIGQGWDAQSQSGEEKPKNASAMGSHDPKVLSYSHKYRAGSQLASAKSLGLAQAKGSPYKKIDNNDLKLS